MTSEGEYRERDDSRELLDELDRVRYDVFLALADYDVADQLIDIDPKGEHYRCASYMKSQYQELTQDPPLEFNWAEISADGRGEANTALIAANMYRLEKDFQDSLIEDAVVTRRIMEKIIEQLEADEEVDRDFFWQSAMNKKHYQILFDIFYGKNLSDPWQKFYHGVTEQFEPVDYGKPDDVAIFVNVENAYWHFEETVAAHNMILREAAEAAGLFRIKDDSEMVVRLATILVETQLIAMRDREQGFWSDGIKEYGRQWNVGDKLIETLSALYRERYLQD